MTTRKVKLVRRKQVLFVKSYVGLPQHPYAFPYINLSHKALERLRGDNPDKVISVFRGKISANMKDSGELLFAYPRVWFFPRLPSGTLSREVLLSAEQGAYSTSRVVAPKKEPPKKRPRFTLVRRK